MMKMSKDVAFKVAAFTGLFGGSTLVFAEEPTGGGVDVSGVISAVQAAGTDIATVGTAIIAVAAIVFAFRWIKAAFF